MHMNSLMRKPAFCTCENKGADQLYGNHTADQRLCFRYIDTTIPLLHLSERGRALSPFFDPLQKPKYESYRTTISSRRFIS